MKLIVRMTPVCMGEIFEFVFAISFYKLLGDLEDTDPASG
jgi:hypothetical protein